MRRKRRSFSEEFKAEAVAMVWQRGLSIGQVAADLDLTESALRLWVKRAEETDGRVASGGLSDGENTELARLRREVRVLREEREILKKAATFFAKERS